MTGRKRPRLALLLSAVFPGLGQIYCGRWGLGIAMALLQLLSLTLIFQFVGLITSPLIWLWGMVGAWSLAKERQASSRYSLRM